MPHHQHLSSAAYAYIAVVIAAGLLAVAHSVMVAVSRAARVTSVVVPCRSDAADRIVLGQGAVNRGANFGVGSIRFRGRFALWTSGGHPIVALDSLVMSMWFRRGQHFGLRRSLISQQWRSPSGLQRPPSSG